MSQSSNTFQHKCLIQQGYQGLSPGELRQLEWGLRFTPSMCSAITVLGLVFQLPALLFAVSALGIWAFFAPAAHPMDLLYNHGVRHVLGAVKLPPNPFPRRMACLAAGVMNSVAAVLFVLNAPIAATVVGVSLIGLQAIVIFTHFCTLSWTLEGLAKLVRRSAPALTPEQIRALVSEGAMIVDVRTVSEFSRGHIGGSQNFPLDEITKHISALEGNTCLVYCASGMRSRIAAKQLSQIGITDVHNIGSLSTARSILE
ncbi:MAG: DUF4395 family protein [Myxococcales bacterium]|nr:DUF4395 family protein [Myxococcales bacterium]